MFPTRSALVLLIVMAAVYFYGLPTTGLVGPDEPRYASIGRAMAKSGDWVTPRLWGDPWFEKPPLLYWLIALGVEAGFGPETSARLPVALIGWSFLVVFYVILARSFGPTEALYSTAILGTSAGWLAFSYVAVMDVPMAALFFASMLLALPWIGTEARPVADWLPAAIAGALLGLAALAKGLVPLVLFAPVVWVARRRWRELAIVGAACFAVAAPWYALCTMRNGSAFLYEFFWRHHFERFATDALQHVRPWWFYLPVILAGVFPWTPLAALIRGEMRIDARLKFLAVWTVYAFIFFSASRNKLPGYMTPLLPALAILFGIGLAWARRTRAPLFLSALLVAATPVVAAILPDALAVGLSRTPLRIGAWWWALPFVVLAVLSLWLEVRSWRTEALLVAAMAAVLAAAFLKARALPAINRTASVRPFYREHKNWLQGACLQDVRRDAQYGLNFYAGQKFPECSGGAVSPKVMSVGKKLILLD